MRTKGLSPRHVSHRIGNSDEAEEDDEDDEEEDILEVRRRGHGAVAEPSAEADGVPSSGPKGSSLPGGTS